MNLGKKLIGSLLLFSLLQADGQAPSFMPIEPSEDFYNGSDIYIEVQVSDQSTIEDILIFYRFAADKSFSNLPMKKEIFYTVIIPGIYVSSGKMDYYFFARDEHGNQSTWPLEGEDSPASVPVFEQLNSDTSDSKIAIDLLNPLPNTTSSDGSIIILSLYDPEGVMEKENIRLMVDDKDVSKDLYTSLDLATFVPVMPLSSGEHIIEFKLADDNGIYLKKQFKFNISSVDLSTFEQTNWKEKSKFQGNISYYSNYDEFFGKERPENRPLDSHKINASMKFSFGQIKVKTSALFNTHLIDKEASAALNRNQPINRMGIGLLSPNLDLRYGDFSTEFSEFTLKGTRVRGIYSKLKLGPWHNSYVTGNTKEEINPITQTEEDSTTWTQIFVAIEGNDSTFTYAQHTKGTASRKMNAFRSELVFSKVNFGLNALTSFDDINALNIPYDEFYDQYTFLGNAVIGADFTILLNNKKTQFKAETAISLTNDLQGIPIDTLAESLDMPQDVLDETKDLFNSIENLVGFNINSDLIVGSAEGRGISVPLPKMDSLNIANYIKNDLLKQGTYRFIFKTPIRFEDNNIDVLTEYRRIPSNFVSFGNSSIQSDVQGLKSTLKARLLNNKLSLNIGYDNEHDNLMGEKPDEKLKSVTTTSLTSSAGFGLSIPEMPTINYSIRVMNREGISIENNTLSNLNTTVTHTINPLYKFDFNKDLNVNMNGNFMIMTYVDNLYNPIFVTQNPNFKTKSYTGSLALRFNSPLTLNMGWGVSINTPEDSDQMPTQFSVLMSKIGYKFLDKTLRTFLGINIVNGEKNADGNGDGEIDNSKLTIKCGTQYKLAQNISVGLNIDYLSLIDNVASDNNYSELKGKLKVKIGF